MGASVSKSPQQRRNTVLKRSQRKSIHGVKARALNLIKELKKFDGVNPDKLNDLNLRLTYLFKELERIERNLQPQLKGIDNETRKILEDAENLLKIKQDEIETIPINNNEEQENNNDEKREEEEDSPEQLSQEKRDLSLSKKSLVEVRIMKIETPKEDEKQERNSFLKIGVPVMPGAIMKEIKRKSSLKKEDDEEKISKIRHQLEDLENEISKFVGRKNGRYYNRLNDRLYNYKRQLKDIKSDDEIVKEQVKLCLKYVNSCVTFLNEKAIDGGEISDDEYLDNVFTSPPISPNPQGFKATFV